MRKEKLPLAIFGGYHRKYTTLFIQIDGPQIIWISSENHKVFLSRNYLLPRIKDFLAHD